MLLHTLQNITATTATESQRLQQRGLLFPLVESHMCISRARAAAGVPVIFRLQVNLYPPDYNAIC